MKNKNQKLRQFWNHGINPITGLTRGKTSSSKEPQKIYVLPTKYQR